MNKILTVTALMLVLFAPATLRAQTPAAPAENPAHQELRQLRDGLLEAMNKADLEGTLKYFHTNCVVTWHNAEVSRGHDGMRAYFNRVMTGPNKIVDSFNCSVNVDELTILYGESDNVGICFGSSNEHFKLANGKNLDVKGRWTATLVKEDGHWLVASLHVSTNLFDNVMLDMAKKTAMVAAIISLVAGVVVGWLVGRQRKANAVPA
jgi:ketosteroid isomerase-like protein